MTRSTFNAAKEAIEVILICNLMAKVGLTVEDEESARAALAFGAKVLSLAMEKDVTPEVFRQKLDRVVKTYRADPASAVMLERVSDALATHLDRPQ